MKRDRVFRGPNFSLFQKVEVDGFWWTKLQRPIDKQRPCSILFFCDIFESRVSYGVPVASHLWLTP